MTRKGGTIVTRELIEKVKAAKERSPVPTHQALAREFGVGIGTISNILRGQITPVEDKVGDTSLEPNETTEWAYDGEVATLTIRAFNLKNLPAALKYGGADLSEWEVDPKGIRFSQVTMRLRRFDARGNPLPDEPKTFTNWHIKLRRKSPAVRSLELLLEKIAAAQPFLPAVKRPRIPKVAPRRELEISILDPHLGLRCYQPGSDHVWDIATCRRMVMTMIDQLLAGAKCYGPFEKIVLPWGNDFLHADNVFGTTTAGTIQPEAEAWQHVYVEAETLAIAMVERLKQEAPVEIIVIPGNHDRQSVFTLGRLLAAYYRHDQDIVVDASASPYKFHEYGVNLIGLDHGHSIRQTLRLASLMANECPQAWSRTVYREWHLGDQHRKGSAKPTMMEEQGVSVEYLPGLTAPNEWHRLKGYNHQKRAGMAFVWDAAAGPVARLQVNVNSYTGQIM